MTLARYLIVKQDENWVIRYQDEAFGPYTSQSEALMFAVEAAKDMERNGSAAEVCVEGENGHCRPEWASGRADESPKTMERN